MARRFVLGIMTGANTYVADRGTLLDVSFRFIAPPDMTVAAEDSILAAVNAVRRTTSGGACPDGSFLPRKLEFIREGLVNGKYIKNSVSVAVDARSNLLAAATAIRGTLQGLTPGFPVTCIKLHGENFGNIYDQYRDPNTPVVVGDNSRGTNPTQPIYSFLMGYRSDALFGTPGTVARVSFKMNSPVLAAAAVSSSGAYPPILGAAGTACIGDLVEGGACPGKERREPRRYLLSLAVTVPGGGETLENKEVPVGSSTATDIAACATALANLPPVVCMGYQGENYDRFHNLLP